MYCTLQPLLQRTLVDRRGNRCSVHNKHGLHPVKYSGSSSNGDTPVPYSQTIASSMQHVCAHSTLGVTQLDRKNVFPQRKLFANTGPSVAATVAAVANSCRYIELSSHALGSHPTTTPLCIRPWTASLFLSLASRTPTVHGPSCSECVAQHHNTVTRCPPVPLPTSLQLAQLRPRIPPISVSSVSSHAHNLGRLAGANMH